MRKCPRLKTDVSDAQTCPARLLTEPIVAAPASGSCYIGPADTEHRRKNALSGPVDGKDGASLLDEGDVRQNEREEGFGHTGAQALEDTSGHVAIVVLASSCAYCRSENCDSSDEEGEPSSGEEGQGNEDLIGTLLAEACVTVTPYTQIVANSYKQRGPCREIDDLGNFNVLRRRMILERHISNLSSSTF